MACEMSQSPDVAGKREREGVLLPALPRGSTLATAQCASRKGAIAVRRTPAKALAGGHTFPPHGGRMVGAGEEAGGMFDPKRRAVQF